MMIRPAMMAAVLALLASAATAQTTQPDATPFQMPKAEEPPPPSGGNGYQLPGDRSDQSGPMDALLNNLLSKAQPHLEELARDMGGLVSEFAPVLDELSGLMDDIANYELPPERLANGDIIIRRKADAPPPPPLDQLNNLLPKTQPAEPGKPFVTPPHGNQVEL